MPQPLFDPLFPYPCMEAALHVLRRDPSHNRIPAGESEAVARAAWDRGASLARLEAEADGVLPMREKMASHGIAVTFVDGDHVAAGVRLFGQYDADARTATVYAKAAAAWAGANRLAMDDAVEIVLAHEFYHHLECGKYGPTTRMYTVPILRIAGLELGTAGIAALSEIGAYGFSHTYFTLLTETLSKEAT